MSTILQFLFKATLFIGFFCVTDTGQNMGVPTSFIVDHVEALSCASKSHVAAGAVSLVGRLLHLYIISLQHKAYWCQCFSDWQWNKKLPILCPSMTLQWFRILYSFKSTTPPECFIVWLVTSQVATKYFFYQSNCYQPQSDCYLDKVRSL